MQIPLILDPSTDQSLTSQLVGQLRAAITRGRIARGTKLPSSRRLSEQLGVSRNTVVRAYEELCSEGYVEARPASCVAVVACLPDSMAVPTDAAPGLHHHDGDESVEMPMPALQPRCQDLVNRSRNRLSFDFFPGRPSAGLFPIKTWRRLLQNCLSHGGAIGLSHYVDPAGLASLRSAIASHLAAAARLVAAASRIGLTSGSHEGMNIGTFSKSLGAGLRLGYMVVPLQLAEATRTAKTLLNNGNPWLEQAALAEMMRCGSYSAHLVRIRARYRDSRDALLASLRRHF